MTWRMTRRCRVRRMPRSPKALVRWPVVSEVLMRSPVQARCAGVADIFKSLFSKLSASFSDPLKYSAARPGSGVDWNQSNDVIVHDVSEEQQKEDKADLNDALFDRHAQIAAHQAFNTKQENLAAVENRDRQKIQDPKVDADESHEHNHFRWPVMYRVSGNLRDADDALQLLDGGAPA